MSHVKNTKDTKLASDFHFRHLLANQEQTEKAVELVKKMQFTYNYEAFENPALQTHYANIEAMALDRDAPEEIVDYTREFGKTRN